MDRVIEEQVKLLKRYYKLDEKRKTFDVVFHFEKASDLFDENIESISSPKMKDEIIGKIVNVIEDIPRGYKGDISLVVDDYEHYDKQQILDSFNDLLLLNRYRYNRESKSKWFKVAFLILTGVLLLFLVNLCRINNFWGMLDDSEIAKDVILAITEISGWVFIWESVSIIFLQKSGIIRNGAVMISKISSIALYQGDSDKALVKETTQQIAKNLIADDATKRIGSLLLMFAGFAMVAVGFMQLINLISDFTVGDNVAASILTLFGGIIGTLTGVGAGLFALLLYRGREEFKIPVIIVASIELTILIAGITSMILFGVSVSDLVLTILAILVHVGYVVGMVLYLVGEQLFKKGGKIDAIR